MMIHDVNDLIHELLAMRAILTQASLALVQGQSYWGDVRIGSCVDIEVG